MSFEVLRCEAKRLELQRKVAECRKPDAYIMKLKYMKLTKYLKEVEERQREAVLRNQIFLKEFDQFEAHMRTASSALIQKMEARYGREIKSVLSLEEGGLSAAGDGEEEGGEQVPRVGRQAAVSGGLYHPATVFMGHHTAAIMATRGLGMWQEPPQATESCSAPNLPSCSPSLEGLGLETRSTGLKSNAARRGGLAAIKESSKQLISSASDPKPATPEEEQPQGSTPGSRPRLSSWWTSKEASWESRDEPSVPTRAKGMMPSNPDVPRGMSPLVAGWERDRDAQAVEGSSQQPPNPPADQEPPLVSSAPDGFCSRASSVKEDDLEAREAVVLHQLPLQRPQDESLLPEKTLGAEGTTMEETQTRPVPPGDEDVPRAPLSHHASFLREHQLPEVAGTLESLQEKAQDGQALPVLREVLPEESGARSSLQSAESSRSVAAILSAGGEPKPAERGWASGDDGSKAKPSQEEHLETSSSSQEQSPPFSRTETRERMATPIKSKAFWGESDESSSEIEAALRPQTHSTEADDFDDFYD